MDTKHLRVAALRNGHTSGQFSVDGKTLSTEDAVKLVQDGAAPGRHPAVRLACKQLIAWMAVHAWSVTAGPHTGGLGGGGYDVDQNRHVTLRVNGNSYHIQLDRRGYPWRVTGRGLVVPAPWSTPAGACARKRGDPVGGRTRPVQRPRSPRG